MARPGTNIAFIPYDHGLEGHGKYETITMDRIYIWGWGGVWGEENDCLKFESLLSAIDLHRLKTANVTELSTVGCLFQYHRSR